MYSRKTLESSNCMGRSEMHSRNATGDEAILRIKEIELIAKLNNREGLEVRAEAEACDDMQRVADQAIVIQSLDRNSSILREVRAALTRVHEGSYGRCPECGDLISPKRATSMPLRLSTA